MLQSHHFTPLLLISLAAFAHGQNDPEAAAPSAAARPGLEAWMAGWSAQQGSAWKVVSEPVSGYAQFLFGGSAPAQSRPVLEADYLDVALAHAAATQAAHGVDLSSLGQGRFTFLPLSLAGSTDKISVNFPQRFGTVPVRGGRLNVLLDTEGRLLSLDSSAVAGLAAPETAPQLSAGDALSYARALFAQEEGLEASDIGTPRLAFEIEVAGKQRLATLVWEIDLRWKQDGFEHAGETYRIAARNGLRLVSRSELIHHCDVGGVVSAFGTPGTKPDSGLNPPIGLAMRYMRITTPLGTTYTDGNGNFNLPGVNTPVLATITFDGLFNDVQNVNGPNYSLSVQLQPGQGNSVVVNPTPSEELTAQVNAFYHINRMVDWTRSVNGSDSSADFLASANVNLNSTCNAYYDGISTNYYLSGGGCVNTAYSTVVNHEHGHWMNDVYGSFNGGDGFGEGNADVFAMYITDQPIVGEDFFGAGSGANIRTGENGTLFCGDSNGGCYGEVHADGEVLMGALWKVRKQLKAALGNAQGAATADLLFNGWMNAYDDGQIKTIIEVHWLTLDDNDGNIDNGTPNYAPIDAGFKQQGFPGYEPPFLKLSLVTELADTKDELGPFGVQAKVEALQNNSISSVKLFTSVGNAAFLPSTMNAAPASIYFASIAGQNAPQTVRYYVEALDNQGHSLRFPQAAPAEWLDYQVGTKSILFYEDFEAGTDEGWTHAQLATQDDWQRGTPAGKSGNSQGVGWQDPSFAAGGTKIWGNDLGNTIGGQAWNGSYQPNVINFLRSPLINATAATSTRLSFKRWLSVEQGIYDKALVKVGNTTVWSNPSNQNVLDTNWMALEYDVAALVDGKSNVQLEWRLETDGGLELGGWNIDDVQLYTLGDVSGSCQMSNLGAGLAGALGVPTLSTAGEPLQVGNASFRLQLKNAVASSTSFFTVGFSQTALPLVGGTLYVVPALNFVRPTDLFGQARVDLAIPADPALAGVPLYAQSGVIDPLAPQGFSLTAGLQGLICP